MVRVDAPTSEAGWGCVHSLFTLCCAILGAATGTQTDLLPRAEVASPALDGLPPPLMS